MRNINCLSANRIIRFTQKICNLIPVFLFFHKLAFGAPLIPLEIQDPGVNSTNYAKAQKMLMKSVEAAGGIEIIRTIDNFSIKTRNILEQPQTKTELIVTEIAWLPDKTKQIMKLPAGERIQVLHGDSGWKQVGKKISDLTQAETREMKKGLFRDTINLFKKSDNKELTIQYFGEEIIGEKTNFVLKINDNSGEFFNLYIDSETFLIAKKSYHGSSEVGLATLEEIYSDYREVDGIKIPFKTIVRANGRRFIDSEVIEAKFNLKLDEGFFYKK